VNLAGFWSAVWPNLAADVIWVPLVWAWHHTKLDRKLTEQREHIMRDLREHFEKEIQG
jgi:hypothetical protein